MPEITLPIQGYSIKQTLKKALKYFVLFLLPVLVNQFIITYPDIAQITIGGLLVILVDWAKRYFSFGELLKGLAGKFRYRF